MTATKEIELTPLSVERKTFPKKAGGTFEKIEITAELPNVGKQWLKAWPEDAANVEVGVPFWAIVTATPKQNGGFFYDFKSVAPGQPVNPQPTREIADGDAIRAMHLSLDAKLAQEFAKIHVKLDAIISQQEVDGIKF